MTAGVFRRTPDCVFQSDNTTGAPAFRVCNTFFEPNLIIDQYNTSLEELWLGMASQVWSGPAFVERQPPPFPLPSQLTEKEDAIVGDELRNFVYGRQY